MKQNQVIIKITHKAQVQQKVDKSKSQMNNSVNLKKKVNKLIKQTHQVSQKVQKILKQIFRQF